MCEVLWFWENLDHDGAVVFDTLRFERLVRISENPAKEAIMILFPDSNLEWIFDIFGVLLQFGTVH